MKKAIVILIKNLMPIFYLLYIIAGFTCAAISGIIEYVVFEGLFPDESKTILGVVLIPFLIVFTFEISKIFLVFFKNITEENDTGVYDFLRAILIGISVVATLIFSFYNLNNPEIDEYRQSQQQIMGEEYQANVQRIQNAMKEQQRIMDEERPSGIGERYKFAQTQYNNLQKNLNDENSRFAEQKSNFRNTLISNPQTDNKVVSATLQILLVAFTNNPNYSRQSYVLMIGLLSILISIGIETVIVAVFKVLADRHGDALDFDKEDSEEDLSSTRVVLGRLIPGICIFTSLVILKADFSNISAVMLIMGVGGFVGTMLGCQIAPHSTLAGRRQPEGFERYLPSIIGGLIPAIFGVITVLIFGSDTNVGSVFGFGMAIMAGVAGKISADTVADV